MSGAGPQTGVPISHTRQETVAPISRPGSPRNGLCFLGWETGVPKKRSLFLGVGDRLCWQSLS